MIQELKKLDGTKGLSMHIQVLGTGCATCTALAARVEDAVKKIGIECTLEKVRDINRIIEFGVLTMPALVIDGKIRCSGCVPSTDKIIQMLTQS